MTTEPAEIELPLLAGADFKPSFSVAQDLTGYSVSFRAYDPRGQVMPSYDLSVGNGVTLSPAGTSIISVLVAGSTTASFALKSADYDMLLTSGSGAKDFYFYGKVVKWEEPGRPT